MRKISFMVAPGVRGLPERPAFEGGRGTLCNSGHFAFSGDLRSLRSGERSEQGIFNGLLIW